MKCLIFIASFLFCGSVFANTNPCFQFAEGSKDVTIGWFSKKTVTADTLCVPGEYPNLGLSETISFVLKNGTEIVAEYGATVERYSDTNIRFTLNDGEPAPTQFEATVTKKSKSLIDIAFAGYLIETSAGGKFECVEETDKLGVLRKLTLTQIEDSTQWLLEVTSQPVVPGATPTVEVSSVLTVSLIEDVMFFLTNDDDKITYNIYMDELYMTYLYLNGSEDATYFNCEQD